MPISQSLKSSTYLQPLHPIQSTALHSMKVDQSMITGESEPVESVVNAADPNSLEARNIIFNGSLGKYCTVRYVHTVLHLSFQVNK